MVKPYISLNTGGFEPLRDDMSQSSGYCKEEHIVNIPLTPVISASTGARKDGQMAHNVAGFAGSDHSSNGDSSRGGSGGGVFRGRRRTQGESTLSGEEGALTTMGRFYDKVMHFSIVTRYIFYILPLASCLLAPILLSVYVAPSAKIGGVRMLWFFIWLEVVWCSLWVSKLFAKALPRIFQALVGVVNSGVKKYSLILKALELPLSFVGWTIASLCSFLPLVTRNHDLPAEKFGKIQPWQDRLNKVLISCLVSALIWLAEKLLIQIVSVDYHRRQFASRIKTNKENVKLLEQLFETSRSIFPEYGEFEEEDCLIRSSLNIKQTNVSATPVRYLLGNVSYVQGKVANVFGGIAQEVTGNKNAFNSSAHSLTVCALGRKESAEALAKRIWMSFVPEYHSALTLADMKEVMGPALEAQAEECFRSLDRDSNGDVSLEEMIMYTVHLHKERRDVARSMQDVDNAIAALNNVLSFVAFTIMVLVFVIAQQAAIGVALSGAGTVLISLSFVFAITAQEVLGSCIFLFVKHPYDIGDRVDIDDKKFLVEHISLLYTVFRRVDNNKITQIPNNILNTKNVENITRSKFIQEQLTVAVNFSTSFEDIAELKNGLQLFVGENSRDYQPDVEVEVVGVNDLDKLLLRIEVRHRENWTESLTLQRRNRFIMALVSVLRRIPIYAPGAGDPVVGDLGKPMYTVTISDEVARGNIKKAQADKAAKKWDYREEDSDVDEKEGARKEYSSTGFMTFAAETNVEHPPFSGTPNSSRDPLESARGEGEETRGMLSRGLTVGRRRVAQAPASNTGIQQQQQQLR